MESFSLASTETSTLGRTILANISCQIQIPFLIAQISPPGSTNHTATSSSSPTSPPLNQAIFMNNILACSTSHHSLFLLHLIKTNWTRRSLFNLHMRPQPTLPSLKEKLMKPLTDAGTR